MVVLELGATTAGGSSFSTGHDRWVVRDLGFWNPRTVVEHRGMQVATLNRSFFGSKARIEVPSGRKYFCRVRSSPLVRLSVHNAGGVEVLSYRLDAHLRPGIVLEVRNTWTPRNDLLMLIMLGYHALEGIRGEHAEPSPAEMTGAGG